MSPRRSSRTRKTPATYNPSPEATSKTTGRGSRKRQVDEDEEEEQEDVAMEEASHDESNQEQQSDVDQDEGQEEEEGEEENDEEEESEEEVSSSEEEEEEEEDDEDFGAKKPSKSPRKKAASPPKTPKQPAPTKRRAIQVKATPTVSRPKPAATPSKNSGSTISLARRRALHKALQQMAAKVLDSDKERPETSLVAALLHSAAPLPKAFPRIAASNTASPTASAYTPQLDVIARTVVHALEEDANVGHIQLLNLLFRSVGGSLETCLSTTETDLEDLSDEQWDDVVTAVVTVMRQQETTEKTLLTASPNGAPQANKTTTMAVQEYRSIYEEFWIILGRNILTGKSAPLNVQKETGKDEEDASAVDSLDKDEEDDEMDRILSEKSKKTSTTKSKTDAVGNARFQVEMMRDLIARLTELVPVGQPDLRAAATVAVLQLALSIAHHTVDLMQKLETAKRQYQSSVQAGGMKSRLKALQSQIDSWKRIMGELEELMEGPVLQGCFMHRYRDSDPHIRASCLEALSQLALLRPDLFLMDKYLKYLGWMASDKHPSVRKAALEGLLAPFQKVKELDSTNAKGGSKQSLPKALMIDLAAMHNVAQKFLNRFVECVDDVDISVQEVAMTLLMAMLQAEFLDEWEDEQGWTQVNLKAIDPETTHQVRKDALYFIMEQLNSFDVEDDEDIASHGLPEKQQSERLDAIATWLAHQLTDNSDMPLDKVRVKFADLLVESLRDMPEHSCLATNWGALLKAIRSHSTSEGETPRREVIKQRILLRMLATAANQDQMEGGNSATNTKIGKKAGKKKGRNSSIVEQSPAEVLTLALLKALPPLLIAYKGDIVALRSLTELPRYMVAEVFDVTSHKARFQALTKSICGLFLETTDEITLENLAQTLALMVQGNHARVHDATMQLRKIAGHLLERIQELFQDKASPKAKKARKSKGTPNSSQESEDFDFFDSSPELDLENSIYMCLLRLRVLSDHCPVNCMFGEGADEEVDQELEEPCGQIAQALAERLRLRKPVERDNGGYGPAPIWKQVDSQVHIKLAKSLKHALQFLLNVVCWKMSSDFPELASMNDDTEIDEEESTDVDPSTLVVVRMRDRIVELLGICYDQYIDENDEHFFTDDNLEFASVVQAHAGHAAGDLRALFLKEFKSARNGRLRALALIEDNALVGGMARYLKLREPDLFEADGTNRRKQSHRDGMVEAKNVEDILLPFARSLVANWNESSRREAGIILSHIAGSGVVAHKAVQETARILRKINPVRFLEAQMACLRMAFEDWLSNEPDDVDDARPTEAQIERYEEEEKRHAHMFKSMESKASRLSASLGVGKLSKKLSQSLLGFMREGIRYSFEGDGQGVEDNLVLGSRLPFLTIISKYSNWLKKDKENLRIIAMYLNEREAEMEAHAEFDDVHEDDLKQLAGFRVSLGLRDLGIASRAFPPSPSSTRGDESSVAITPSTTGSGRRRRSAHFSRQSMTSTQSSLSPIEETDGDTEDPSPRQKRRRIDRRRDDSLGSSITMSIGVKTTLEETDDEE